MIFNLNETTFISYWIGVKLSIKIWNVLGDQKDYISSADELVEAKMRIAKLALWGGTKCFYNYFS